MTLTATLDERGWKWWQQGDCLLVNADAREVLPLIADASIDCALSDPPYGHNNNNGDLIHRREAALGRLPSGSDSPPVESRPIANDGPEANDLARWAFGEFERVLKSGCCCCCCCGGGGPDPQFARWSLWLDEVLDYKQMIVWDKGPMGMGWHYRRSYETVLVAQKPGAACKWHDESSSIENIIRPGQFGIRKIIPQADDHPCAKPVELAEYFLSLHTQEGDLVLDPFGGHFWVGRACIRMGRQFIGIECDPKFYLEGVEKIRQEVARTRLFAPTPPITQSHLWEK